MQIIDEILQYLHYHPASSRGEIIENISADDYKKAMLIFYEQNSLFAFKKNFMEQFEFGVKTYSLSKSAYVSIGILKCVKMFYK